MISPHPHTACTVNSHNEWDPLEEVIVGDLTNATIPSGPGAAICGGSRLLANFQPLFAGFRYPKAVLNKAKQELEGFVALLAREGVVVRRPEPQPFSQRFSTPMWSSHGYSCASPRDALLVIGNEIIEAPMSWRSRYFETFAYRRLLRKYFDAGARWTSAPKPELHDELYDAAYPQRGEADSTASRYVINEFEPVFDAADFVRCGRDIFAIRSNTANRAGIAWLDRHLNRMSEPDDPAYRIHEIQIRNEHAMHIDHHFMPLAPGRVLVNPEWVVIDSLPEALRGWEILRAPKSDDAGAGPLHFYDECRRWLNMNVLSLDEKRVIVEENQPSMIKALRQWGFEPIPCAFRHYGTFGGAFHCATLDIRRRGDLKSYCG